jgi:proteasome accessory factor C
MQLLLEHALREHVRVRIRYAGAGGNGVSERVIQPHLLVGHEGMGYCVSWCERADGWRRFRFDRILEATVLDGFAPRDDFDATGQGTAFDAPDERVDRVTVRFSSRIARWITERHPDAVTKGDGSAEVAFRVAGPDWLIRHVLQYGPDAEVVEPGGYRERMRMAMSG